MKCVYVNLRFLAMLSQKSLMPDMSFKDNILYELCIKDKQVKNSIKSINVVSKQRPLELIIHLYLFGPTRTQSLSGLIIIDDYTR